MPYAVATVLRALAVVVGCVSIALPAVAQRPNDGRDEHRRPDFQRAAPPSTARPAAPQTREAPPAFRREAQPQFRPNVPPGVRPDYRSGFRPDYRPGFRSEPAFRPGYRPEPGFRPDYRPGFRPGIEAWRGGGWRHEWHDGRFGWWWVLGSSWYFYSAPIYPYPPYMPDVYAPPVYAAPVPGGLPPPQFWYYCDDPSGYYPYVAFCRVAWREVPAYQYP